jgi:thiol-disulfide isomerase/thioredoxin
MPRLLQLRVSFKTRGDASNDSARLHCGKEFQLVKSKLLSWFCIAAFAFSSFGQDSNGLRKAPELAFTLPGEGERLLSQYRGKVVALEFILTTCPHCQAASRLMTRLQQEYGPRGFQALDLAINGLDEGRTPQQADLLVETFARSFQVGFPVGWIPRDRFVPFMGFSFAELTVVPQLVLIDRKGYIHYQTPAKGEENAMKEATIRQRMEELLAAGNGVSTKTRSVAKRGP